MTLPCGILIASFICVLHLGNVLNRHVRLCLRVMNVTFEMTLSGINEALVFRDLLDRDG